MAWNGIWDMITTQNLGFWDLQKSKFIKALRKALSKCHLITNNNFNFAYFSVIPIYTWPIIREIILLREILTAMLWGFSELTSVFIQKCFHLVGGENQCLQPVSRLYFSCAATIRFGNWNVTYFLVNIFHLCCQGKVGYSLMSIFTDSSLFWNEKPFKIFENLAFFFFSSLSYLRQKHRKPPKLKLPSSDKYLNSLI